MEARVRLLRGSVDVHTAQLQAIIGTPCEVPVPRKITSIFGHGNPMRHIWKVETDLAWGGLRRWITSRPLPAAAHAIRRHDDPDLLRVCRALLGLGRTGSADRAAALANRLRAGVVRDVFDAGLRAGPFHRRD